MGCTSSKQTVNTAPMTVAEQSISTPVSIGNCSVDGLFICEVSSDYVDKSKSRRLSFSTAKSTVILPSKSLDPLLIAKLSIVFEKLEAREASYLALRSFASWRLSSMKSKNALSNSLVVLAKQMPQLTQQSVPQLQGM